MCLLTANINEDVLKWNIQNLAVHFRETDRDLLICLSWAKERG